MPSKDSAAQALMLAAKGVTSEKVMNELIAIAFADIGDVLEACDPEVDGTVGYFRVRNLDSLTLAQRTPIKKVIEKQTARGIESSVEMHSKISALALIDKILERGNDDKSKGLAAAASGKGSGATMGENESNRLYASMLDAKPMHLIKKASEKPL